MALVSVVGDETQRVDVDWVNRLRLLAPKRLIPVEESAFRNGIQRGLSGPFGGLHDPFGECRFSWVNVSLGYDVLPGSKSTASLFVSMVPLPFCQARR